MWNPAGTRLVTGDASGAVFVWKADLTARGSLALFKEYAVGSGVTSAVFSTQGIGAARPEMLAHAFSPAFFVGTRTGSVYYADDLGHSTEVQALGARVDHMLFDERADRLVVLTRSLVLVQLQIGSDGKVLPVMKMKVAVAGGAADRGTIRNMCWAGPGVVAAATGESLVRFWNLANDETYVISLASARGLDRSSRVASVAFNPLQRYLAVGTREGKIAMWRFVGESYGNDHRGDFDDGVADGPLALSGHGASSSSSSSGKAPSAADWEALPVTAACGGAGAIDVLAWGPGHGLLAASAAAEGATSLLSETVLHRVLKDDVGAIQQSTDAVRLQRQNGASTVLRTEVLSIRILAVASRYVVCSNGHECRVFEWSAEMGDEAPREVAKFPSTARALVVRDDTIIRATPSSQTVDLCNLSGVIKQKITFTVDEGMPEHLDLNGKFLAVATSTGLIKVFQIDRREPKQLGSPGRFDLLNVDGAAGGGHFKGATGTDILSDLDASSKDKRRGGGILMGGAAAPPAAATKVAGHAIRSIRVNADGTRVSILADRVHGASVRIREPESRLFVYDSDRDLVDSHEFGDRRRFPISHFWDPREPKLLACETRSARQAPESSVAPGTTTSVTSARGAAAAASPKYNSLGLENQAGEDSQLQGDGRSGVLQKKLQFDDGAGTKVEVASLFVTPDFGMLLQDVFALEAPLDALLGVQVPRFFFTRSGAKDNVDDDLVAEEMTAGGGDVAKKNKKSKSEEANVDRGTTRGSHAVGLCSRVMRDFVGLDDNCDDEARQALLDFSYYLTVGNMDEAHRAVRLIKSPSVWENMAHMCVKTKRLDVAEVCLGHMGHARGAAAVRAAKKDAPEVEARVAAVAIQLGLRNDAARLYRECGRYDLLNRLYQAAGAWDLALETAARSDRIHLRSTHHRFALHLEALGHFDGAATHFELADTHRREVPRMLVSRGEQAALERYIMRSDDTQLLKWWAGYCESLGHFDSAQHCYESAKDHYNLVRVACFNDKQRLAADIVLESRSGAAAYHLARHLESKHDINGAIQYFAKSGCYNHAIRLAKEYGLDADLLQFAIKARPSLQVECATYFERKGDFEKAVQLYQMGGELAKALDLCFKVGSGRAQMFEVLSNISANLDESASPAVLARCAEFFIEHNQFNEAVNLYITGQRYSQAIQLCVDKRVQITEDLAEQLTPPTPDGNKRKGAGAGDSSPNNAATSGEAKQRDGDDPGGGGGVVGDDMMMLNGSTRRKKRVMSNEERLEVLNELARACKKQSQFQLACKKYTQAGDRARALKCLLKSGDTKNIIYYATVSRNRDIYILAANYLQSLDWQSGSDAAAELTKKIVEFYTKARAYEQLAAFYDAYAQMEIDEYRDYEKAAGALREARTQLDKAKQMVDRDRRVAALDARVAIVEAFIEARSYEKTDPKRMAELCAALLSRRDVDAAIRVGDAYALLVEYHFKAGHAHDAYELVEQMRQKRIILHPYIEHDLLTQIHAAVGADLPNDDNGAAAIDDDENNIPEDAIHDDVFNGDDESQELNFHK